MSERRIARGGRARRASHKDRSESLVAPADRAASPALSAAGRNERSLLRITSAFVQMLREAPGQTLDIVEVEAKMREMGLEIKRRRLSDVINVLEGVRLVEKVLTRNRQYKIRICGSSCQERNVAGQRSMEAARLRVRDLHVEECRLNALTEILETACRNRPRDPLAVALPADIAASDDDGRVHIVVSSPAAEWAVGGEGSISATPGMDVVAVVAPATTMIRTTSAAPTSNLLADCASQERRSLRVQSAVRAPLDVVVVQMQGSGTQTAAVSPAATDLAAPHTAAVEIGSPEIPTADYRARRRNARSTSPPLSAAADLVSRNLALGASPTSNGAVPRRSTGRAKRSSATGEAPTQPVKRARRGANGDQDPSGAIDTRGCSRVVASPMVMEQPLRYKFTLGKDESVFDAFDIPVTGRTLQR